MLHDLTLPGPLITLVPLELEHAAPWAAIGDAAAYTWHTSPPPLTVAAAEDNVRLFHDHPTIQAFAVLETESGAVRGVTSFYDHVESIPRVEIGNTFFGRRYWGGDTNPHVKLQMLSQAFDTWRCERVALRCDAANERSARAIERLGGRPEGVLRAHRRRHDGAVADTAYFSIVAAEWPEVRRGLEQRIAAVQAPR